jgi:hypothetical protein
VKFPIAEFPDDNADRIVIPESQHGLLSEREICTSIDTTKITRTPIEEFSDEAYAIPRAELKPNRVHEPFILILTLVGVRFLLPEFADGGEHIPIPEPQYELLRHTGKPDNKASRIQDQLELEHSYQVFLAYSIPLMNSSH